MQLIREVQYLLRCCAVFGIYVHHHTGALAGTKAGISVTNVKKLFYIYSVAIIMLLITISVIGLKYEIFYDLRLLSWLVNTIVFLTQTITHTIIIIESIFYGRYHEQFLRKLLECEDYLTIHLRVRIPRVALKRDIRGTLLTLFVIASTGLTVFAWVYVSNQATGFLWYGLFTMFAMRLRLLQILVYLKIIVCYLQCYNQKLQQLVVYTLQQQHGLLDINYDYLRRQTYALTLHRSYNLIYQCCYMLNDIFGWSLMSIILCYLFDATLHTYWSLLTLDGKYAKITIIGTSAWLFHLLSVVWYFCGTCDKLKKEGRESCNYVNKLMNSVNHGEERNQNFIYNFALQMQHQPLQITAKHIFIIDLNLLMTIFASIVGYLIILIQFLNMTELQNNATHAAAAAHDDQQ